MKRLALIPVALLALIALAACSDTAGTDQSRQEAVNDREANFDRAEARWPAPANLTNFPLRQALVKFTERQDMVNHPWYIYVMGMDGTYLGYYIGTVYPINACNFLSPTERVLDDAQRDGSGNDFIVTSPSYDGIFYGGGGASGACDVYFSFDITTDAMFTFNLFFFAVDAPLNLPGVQRLIPGAPADAAPAATPEG